MRILQLCHKPPFPPIDGGTKAMHYLTKGLLGLGHEVKVICLSTPKHPLDMSKVPNDLRKRTGIEGVFVDTSMNIVDMFTDLITMDNYNISRFFSPDLDIRLIQILSKEKFDIIHLESLFMTPYLQNIRRYSNAPVILRSHNQEYLIQERLARNEKNILFRPYRKFLARQLKDHEMGVLHRVDAVAAISDEDAAKFKEYHAELKVKTIPFGVDLADYPVEPYRDGETTEFFHLGSMDWAPNEEGVRWLVENIWPKVVANEPNARLNLAGNRMPEDLMDLELPGLKVKGRVSSARAFMNASDVMVVPLFSAGGMRVKIIEGMALGKAIISTPVGAEGIDHEHGKNIMIAKNHSEFIEHMITLARDPELRNRIGLEGRKLISRCYDNRRIVSDLVDFYKEVGE